MSRRGRRESRQIASFLQYILENNKNKKQGKKNPSSEQQQAKNKNQNKKTNKKEEQGHKGGGTTKGCKWGAVLPQLASSNNNHHHHKNNNFANSTFSASRSRRRSSLLERLWAVIDRQFPDPPDPGIDPSDDLVLPDADQTFQELDFRTTCVSLSTTLLAIYTRLSSASPSPHNCAALFGALAVSPMATSMLDQFLSGISQVVAHRQGDDLRELLQVLPERMRDGYRAMAIELRANYPSGPGDEALMKRCEALVPKTTEGTTWPAFPIFIRSYLAYLRDGNISNQLEAYKALNGVLYQCMQALGDSQMGAIVLRTVIYLSQVVAGLAMALENDPELLRKLRADEPQDAFERSNLVEDAANVVREGFIKCLTDRVGTTGTKGRPEGKRAGVYLMVNQCLKLLHRCGSLRGADTIFKSISAQSAPLSFYPAAQRVTYLYYLGLYLFSNNQFFLAHKALWESYMQCHVNCYQQKRHILIHLISCNIVMGRFPSLALLQKPEARGLPQIFIPLCKLICSGDYLSFRDHFRQGSPTAEWYIKNGLLYQIRNRCELLVWRSLIRKVFIYGGFHGDPTAQRSPPPMLHLSKLETAVRFIQARHSGHIGATTFSSIETNGFSDVFTLHTSRDSDYDVITDFPSTLSASRDATDDADYLYPPGYYDQNGVFVENSDGQRVPGHEDEEYAGDIGDLVPYSNDHSEIEHTSRLLRDLESIVASLINQNLLGGYLTHNPARFVIPGAKHVGAMAKGFPNVWQTISSQQERHGNVVPAWVIAPQSAFDQPALTSAAGGSRVVNLTGAKAVGS